MKIWTPQACVPAAAITYAGGNTNNQPILFTTQFNVIGVYTQTSIDETGKEKKEDQQVELKWVIKSVQVTLNRDWGTSQCLLSLTCHLPCLSDPIPPLPDISLLRGGNYPNLTYEDEIRIYSGYVESPNTPITGDLLDDIPIDFTDLDGVQYKQSSEKPLAPIFWGFIDKIDFSGDIKGLQILISCRDRTRIFADTRLLSIPAFSGTTTSNTGASTIDELDASGISKGDRAQILLQVAQGAAGNTLGENSKNDKKCACWKNIIPGPHIVKGFTEDSGGTYKYKYPQEDPAAWIRESTHRLFSDNAEPRFNIWVERPPIRKGEPNATLQIVNKSPMEIIDYLAKTEERPMDFFASHVNGDFVFGPRAIDFSGFTDQDRNYRTYFFRNYPTSIATSPPSPGQMIIEVRAVSSTMATFNKFVVVDANTRNAGASLLSSVKQGFFALPWQLQNRDPTPPCRTQIVYDAALGTYENPQEGALVIGLAAARIWSRDVNGIQLKILGDPTIYPSEAIRVYNSFLHDTNTLVIVDNDSAEKKNREVREKLDSVSAETSSLKESDRLNTCKTQAANDVADEMLNNNPGRLPTNVNNLVLPVYKIRTVQHNLVAQGQRGFSTTINAVADY